jgi:hypothetical protein
MKNPHTNSTRSSSPHNVMLLATAVVLLTQFFDAAAQPAATPPKTVIAKPIGNPTWKPADFQIFTAPIGTAASGYAEFGTTILSILPPPNHQFCADLGGPGPGTPHTPPYTAELSAGVAALGFTTGPLFRPADFSNGNGVYCTWMTIPAQGTTGSSPDFASGPIIPNTLFPLHVSGATYRNGHLINPFLGTFDVPPLNTSLSCPFDVDGQSHFPIFYADNMDFMPAGTKPVGSWEFQITMTDGARDGWAISARFFVKP